MSAALTSNEACRMLVLRLRQHDETAALRPFAVVSSPPGPHSGVTHEVGYGTQAHLKAPSSGEIRRSPESPEGA